ncbi:MAG: radical SAM protein [Verrucomicrobia bacterium]|nr:MAG: radical SAM protein [Verrucomicrobiota bacterium]
MPSRHHRTDHPWLKTSSGEPRGFIDPNGLREVWFHTGTICNLSCPGCYEHSSPSSRRLGMVQFTDLKPFVDEAVARGVEQFSFTGGEPFVVRDMVRILDYALDFRPCLVLTNGTRPLRARLKDVFPLARKSHPLSFRVSLDFPDIGKHDALRGKGMFQFSLETLGELHRTGFQVSVARRRETGEETAATDAAYLPFFESAGLPASTPIVSFPDLGNTKTPEITETCMTTYHSPQTCARFMCAFSRMVVKQQGKMRVYACTLVDDQPQYDLGGTLAESADVRVMLGHPRCFTCFAGGTSCSEL